MRFNILKDCLPLPLSAFKPAIKDNFLSGFKFRQELSSKQVYHFMILCCWGFFLGLPSIMLM